VYVRMCVRACRRVCGCVRYAHSRYVVCVCVFACVVCVHAQGCVRIYVFEFSDQICILGVICAYACVSRESRRGGTTAKSVCVYVCIIVQCRKVAFCGFAEKVCVWVCSSKTGPEGMCVE